MEPQTGKASEQDNPEPIVRNEEELALALGFSKVEPTKKDLTMGIAKFSKPLITAHAQGSAVI